MTVLTQNQVASIIPSFDLGGSNTQTGIAGFYNLQFVEILEDEISDAEIVAKLETLRDSSGVEFQDTSEARDYLKKIMSK